MGMAKWLRVKSGKMGATGVKTEWNKAQKMTENPKIQRVGPILKARAESGKNGATGVKAE